MNTRRDFFKQFIGQVGVIRDEIHGVLKIPLNRLKELPEDIIEQIEPVFFPNESWQLKDGILYIPESKFAKSICIELNNIECTALGCFQNGKKLKQTATEIKKDTDLPFDEIYQMVTSLFFKLASLHLCHPREVNQIEEILKPNR
jgi:hypothetical protein